MSIKLQENTYVQPTEVREEVVQKLVDRIYEDMSQPLSDGSSSITIFNKCYLNECNGLIITQENGGKQQRTRLRGCEIQAVLDIFYVKGYFVYKWESSGSLSYVFYNRPKFGTPTKPILAKFID